MKVITTTISALFLYVASFGQGNIKNVPVPESINVIYYLDAGNNLKALERGQASQVTSRKGALSRAVSVGLTLPNDKSPVRLSADSSLAFVVNLNGLQPDAIALYKVDVKKGNRVATLTSVSGWGKMKGAENVQQLDVKVIRENLYQLSPINKLAKGEYFFTKPSAAVGNTDVFAFGVD